MAQIAPVCRINKLAAQEIGQGRSFVLGREVILRLRVLRCLATLDFCLVAPFLRRARRADTIAAGARCQQNCGQAKPLGVALRFGDA